MKNEFRLDSHKRVEEVEAILSTLKLLLEPIEKEAIKDSTQITHPVYLIFGCARSGTTALMQYLTCLFEFNYPTNFLSRFYYAPYIGSLYQKLLLDLDIKNEIFNLSNSSSDFTSNLGKTIGAKSPHEFWYFWRRFFKFGDIQKLSDVDLLNVDSESMLKEFAAIQGIYHKPFLMKAMNLNWHLNYLADLHESFKFIFIERDVIMNAYSLYKARKEFFNDIHSWYSFKPPEYHYLKDMTPVEQVVGQVIKTNQAIKSQLYSIDKSKIIHIKYEMFCQEPDSYSKFFNDVKRTNKNPSNQIRKSVDYSTIPKNILKELKKAIEMFE